MPRHARIDMLGLLQHVIVRGIERRNIFRSDEDREDFVQRLSGLLEQTATICYAWALLDNHVHLLLMPTETPLAVLMRRLLTGYAVTFNLRHQRSGHLFQNRYKSIVCDKDTYLLELIRYIHLNPLRADKLPDLDALADDPWCGHQQVLGRGRFKLIAADDILPLFGRNKKVARKSYLQFIADGLQQESPQLSQGGRRASRQMNNNLTDEDSYDDRILGGGGFVERVLSHAKVPKEPRTLDGLLKTVADYYGLDVEQLCCPGKARQLVQAKAVICHVATRLYRIPGTEVGKVMNYTPSATSRAAERGRGVMIKNEELRKLLQ